jgi:glutamine amidotransferase-like uncharacterized protein
MKKIYVFFAVVATCLTLSCYRQNAAWAQESDVPIAPQLKAAVFRDSGASDTCAIASLQILNNAPGFEASFISAQEIREGSLKNFDVVLFPGGTGSGESKALGDEGWKELRKFLNDGGGFIGTCAGAYLALVNLSRETGRLIDAELQEGEWERGEAILEIELTEEGRKVLEDFTGTVNVAYQNGPVFHPAHYEGLKPYSVLAYFRTEIAENDAPKGVQVNSPAIAYGAYGKGRVIICSPHPELTPDLNCLVPKMTKFAAQK